MCVRKLFRHCPGEELLVFSRQELDVKVACFLKTKFVGSQWLPELAFERDIYGAVEGRRGSCDVIECPALFMIGCMFAKVDGQKYGAPWLCCFLMSTGPAIASNLSGAPGGFGRVIILLGMLSTV